MTDHKIKVHQERAGMRLDAFVVASVPDISRSQVARLIEGDNILVNGKKVKPSYKVKKDEEIKVSVPKPAEPKAIAEKIPLDIVYEDSDIIVVNKPAGMCVHPAPGHYTGTLVNALLAHCKDLSGIGGEMKAGIVHRLDLGTSGVIVAAKNDKSHHGLAAQFKNRTVSKTYIAIVFGKMRALTGKFDSAIGRSTRDRKKISSHTKKSRTSLTEWKVIQEFGSVLSVVEIKLRTGRMHQIRVHFSEDGHPLVGDETYGGTKKANLLKEESLRELTLNLKRPALHALKLEIDHPRTGKRMSFEAPLPGDIREMLKKLKLNF